MTSKNHLFLVLISVSLLISSSMALLAPHLWRRQQLLIAEYASQAQFQKQIFVNEGTDQFYYYDIYSQDGKILIHILDADLKSYDLTFQKDHALYFRDAYYNVFVVQEGEHNDTVSYWTIQIVSTQNGFELSSFPVSSIIDNEGYLFEGYYFLESIIEYNRRDNILYVNTDATTDTDVYAIDIGNQGPYLIDIGWFNYNQVKPQKLIGGNSRVLVVQAINDQIWIDTRNMRQNTSDPTVYDIYDISSLTSLTIYNGGSQVYNLIDWYFQYVSVNSDSTSISAFVYHGYEKAALQGQRSLTSVNAIKFFYDEYSYFFAIADTDIYSTLAYWDDATSEYFSYSYLLSQVISDANFRTQVIGIFNSALGIVFNDNKLYMLTADTFYVFGTKAQNAQNPQLYKLTLSEPINQGDDARQKQFEQIKAYNQAN